MSTPFFGPEKPVNHFGFIWKFFAVLLAVGGVFSVSIFVNKLQFSSKLNEVSLVMDNMAKLSEVEKTSAGGDIVVEPIEQPKPKMPALVGKLADPDDFAAESIIVKDHESGATLYSKNEYEERSIASITKLMSALVLLEKNPDWNSTTTVIGEDSMGTHMYAGDVYTLNQLWYSALVGSSNKAILSLVNALDWPEEAFVERMNQKAREMGMTNTRFVEPTGLDEGDQSTASDLVILLNNALQSDKIKDALTTPEYNLYSEQRDQSHHMWSTDWLLLDWIDNDFAQIIGGKTGYTNAAGYSFTVSVKNDEGHVLDIVVLGAKEHEDRFTVARDVADMVFQNYQWPDEEEE